MGRGTDTPFFIPFRDRITCLRQLVSWLQDHGMPNESIRILDMDSTYPETVDQLRAWEKDGVRIRWVGENTGQWSLWLKEALIREEIGNDVRFFVSDPDVIPDTTCREDLLDYLHDLLDRALPRFQKVGLGLKLEGAVHSDLGWEKRWWRASFNDEAYIASIATTFALYEKFEPVPWHMKALRTKPPNLGIHLPWFTKKEDLTPDEVYYFENAPQRPHPQRGPGWSYRPE